MATVVLHHRYLTILNQNKRGVVEVQRRCTRHVQTSLRGPCFVVKRESDGIELPKCRHENELTPLPEQGEVIVYVKMLDDTGHAVEISALLSDVDAEDVLTIIRTRSLRSEDHEESPEG